jgi:hypothetical protein
MGGCWLTGSEDLYRAALSTPFDDMELSAAEASLSGISAHRHRLRTPTSTTEPEHPSL